jgi:serine/threonine protein kinase/Tfp pilus assembly protein PilF
LRANWKRAKSVGNQQDRITDIFNLALEHTPAERDEFVRRACGNDNLLRAEIESLLKQYDSNFLEGPSSPALPSISSEAMIGRQLGAYQIVRELGHGGMAIVFLAERADREYRKRVAIKMVKLGVDNKEVLSRFRNERQALAGLDHPNIVKLLDGGSTEEGWPFLVMEFVEGTPIDEYCDGQRLSIAQRLEVFRAVCAAVQHAHQNLVIHRDLKPGNILVTSEGVPRLLDFGIAKLLNPEFFQAPLVTKADMRPMTPEYASPEQVRGETITTASDIYSLGVLLYRLLCGRRPYRQTATLWLDVGRQVCEEEPEKPSTAIWRMGQSSASPDSETASSAQTISKARKTTPDELRRHLRGDLDSIILKALRKEPKQRYASAEQFSADIAAYLHHQPVAAASGNTGYRIRKYVRRHRAGVATAAGLLMLLIAFAGMQTVELRRIIRERDRANRITSFMTNMFKVSSPSEARGNSVTAREILDKAAKEIDGSLTSDPAVQAQMMQVMGTVYNELGLYPTGDTLLTKAYVQEQRILGVNHEETLRTARALGWNLERRGHDLAAEKLQRETVDRDRRVFGKENVETLHVTNDLAWTLQQEGRYAEAEKLGREALAIERRALGPVDSVTLQGIANLGWILTRERRYAEAEQLQRESVEVRRRILGPDAPDTLSATNNLGLTLRHESRFAEAEQLYNQLLETSRRVMGPEHPFTFRVINNLAEVLSDEKRYAEAENFHRQILEVRLRTLGHDHPETLSTIENLGNNLRWEGKYVEAEKFLREALDGRRRALGPEHPDTADTEYDLAGLYAATGKQDQAFAYLKEAVSHGLNPQDDLEIATNPDLNPLHADPRFPDLVAYARQRAAALQSSPK